MKRNRFSRRKFVAVSMASGVQFGASGACAPCGAEARPGKWFRMVQEYVKSQVVAISPDSNWICLNRGSSVTRFRANAGEAFRPIGGVSHRLVLIHVGSWREALVLPLPARLTMASFFAAGQRLLGEVQLPATREIQRLLIDAPSMKTNITTVSVPAGAFYSSLACANDRVVRHETQLSLLTGPRHEETYRLFALRSDLAMVELNRLPEGYATRERFIGFPVISLDRRWLLHWSGLHTMVCRSCIDLQEKWSLYIESPFRLRRTGFSANGAFAVCAIAGVERHSSLEDKGVRRHYVLVIDGEKGAELKRIAISGSEAIAISSDGCLVAAGYVRSHEENGMGVDETLVDVVDTKTGQVLQTLVHSVTKPEDRLESGFGIDGLSFTGDGHYLISSGDSARIWKLVVNGRN